MLFGLGPRFLALWLALVGAGCSGADDASSRSDATPGDSACAADTDCVPARPVCTSGADCPHAASATPACCAGACVDDTGSDPAHCGGCEQRCGPLDNATAACVAGACRVGACNSDYADCDRRASNGCEAHLETDPLHCGGCATSCPSGPNASPSCGAGRCQLVCAAGFADCDGDRADGCEIAIDRDGRHCGGCGNVCGPLPNAAAVECANGACKAGRCLGWFGDCGGIPANGCESDTQADTANCGGCALSCPAPPHGSAGCRAGACVVGLCPSAITYTSASLNPSHLWSAG